MSATLDTLFATLLGIALGALVLAATAAVPYAWVDSSTSTAIGTTLGVALCFWVPTVAMVLEHFFPREGFVDV